MASRAGFRMAATTIAGASIIAADFAPVPYLSPAVGVVIGILKICENVKSNKNEIRELGGRCRAVLYALKDSSPDCAPEKMQAMVETSQQLFEGIQQKMIAWTTVPLMKQFFLQNDITEDVRRCHQAINSFLQTFNITSFMEVHKWMAEFERISLADQNKTIGYLSDIKNNEDLTRNTINANHKELMVVLSKLQGASHVYHSGIKHNGELTLTEINVYRNELTEVQEGNTEYLSGVKNTEELTLNVTNTNCKGLVGMTSRIQEASPEYLSDIKNSEDLSLNVVNANHKELMGMLLRVQEASPVDLLLATDQSLTLYFPLY